MERQWWQKEIVYQIYPKSFNDTNHDGIGDVQGITEKLDYLEDLGVTMLWICPIFKSPMDDNGYDISDYLSLAPEFGTMEDLEELIAKAKNKGIKILLDLVINHTSDEHVWFQEALRSKDSPYHDFYIFKEGKEVPNNWRSVFGGSVWEKVPDWEEYYFHSFGKKQPDLNWENEILRKALYQMVNTWLDKGIAGFRVDAITFIKKDLSYKNYPADGTDGLAKCTKGARNQEGIGEFLHELKKETFERHHCVTVAEAPGVPYEQLKEFMGEDGYFSMIFDFKYADLDVASGSEWFKRVPWTIKDLREKIMASQIALQNSGWGANFIENHDQPRATSKYLREEAFNEDAVKMLGAMYFFLRGTPFIYQGQELGMTNFERESIDEFNDISSIDQYYRSMKEGVTPEDALRYINLRSRDNSRTPFPWENTLYGGFSDKKPWLSMNPNYPDINAAAQAMDQESVLSFYKKMIEVRKTSTFADCLTIGNIKPLKGTDDEVIAYTREDGETRIYCYFNFSGREITEALPAEIQEVVLNNLSKVIMITGGMVLMPYQALVFTVKKGDSYGR